MEQIFTVNPKSRHYQYGAALDITNDLINFSCKYGNLNKEKSFLLIKYLVENKLFHSATNNRCYIYFHTNDKIILHYDYDEKITSIDLFIEHLKEYPLKQAYDDIASAINMLKMVQFSQDNKLFEKSEE